MLKNEDMEMFQKGTGLQSPSRGFVEAAEELYRTMSRMGRSGPLGPELLAGLIQRFKLCAPPDYLHEAVTDWRKVPGETRITYTGKNEETRTGTFVGYTQWGMIVARLDGEEFDREVAPKYCKTIAVTDKADKNEKKDKVAS